MVEWIRAIGSVRADQRVNLSAEVGGILAEIGVEVGDRVEKGALLARLDDERLRIGRDLARAEVEMARAHRTGRRFLLNPNKLLGNNLRHFLHDRRVDWLSLDDVLDVLQQGIEDQAKKLERRIAKVGFM